MKVIIVDDEKSMLLILKRMISKIPDVDILGSFQNTGEAYTFLKENKVDMVFADINMPCESGLDFVRRITKESADIAVVFLTAHKEYALEAFDVNAFDYIVKPISQERLEDSIKRAKKRYVSIHSSKETASDYKLFVYYLGSVEVRGGRGDTIQFSSSKSCELLAYLISKRGRTVSKWNVMEDVFREMPPQNAETYLNTTVYKLRKSLESNGMKLAVKSSYESYKIEIGNIYVDYIDFENRIALLSDFKSINTDYLLETERLYTGELFGEKDYCWSLPEKERLFEVYWNFAKKLVKYLIEENQLSEASQILKRLLYNNELDEEVNCLLMKVYASQRDILALKRQYERYKKVLRKELGISRENMATALYSTLIKSF